jgi:hypothetical protein
MEKINSETDLREAIVQLENKWIDDGKLVKEQFFLTIESIKPINLIKSTFKDAVASPDIKGKILNTSVGLTAGFLSKLIFQGVLKSPLNRLIGTAVMFGITNVVARNPEAVKSIGKGFFKMIRGKSGNWNHTTDKGPGRIAS